jgi:phosphatidylglycerophosphate synthase
VTQHDSGQRTTGEHWAGRLYMRRVSPYFTRRLIATPLSANAVTWLMVPVGLLAALALTIPGVVGAVAAVLLIQLQLLLDCSDGEVARWRRTRSAQGIYADRLTHYITDAALACALGIRADGGWHAIGGWTTLGLTLAVLGLLMKTESTLVEVARAASGLSLDKSPGAARPRPHGLARLWRQLRHAPYKVFETIETTLLVLIAALVDVVVSELSATRALLVGLAVLALLTAAAQLLTVVSSGQLGRPVQAPEHDRIPANHQTDVAG